MTNECNNNFTNTKTTSKLGHDRINNLRWNLWLFSLIIDCTRWLLSKSVVLSVAVAVLTLFPYIYIYIYISLSLSLSLSLYGCLIHIILSANFLTPSILTKCHFNIPMICSKKYVGYSFWRQYLWHCSLHR